MNPLKSLKRRKLPQSPTIVAKSDQFRVRRTHDLLQREVAALGGVRQRARIIRRFEFRSRITISMRVIRPDQKPRELPSLFHIAILTEYRLEKGILIGMSRAHYQRYFLSDTVTCLHCIVHCKRKYCYTTGDKKKYDQEKFLLAIIP